MTPSAPLVSVVTPSYQQARWLRDNLESVARQTYPSIEHIVVDGGSSDGSVEILRTANPSRLRWLSEPDRGQSHALNKAFTASTGEIIGWLNSDDAYFDASAVTAAVEVFRERPEVAVVYGHAVLVNGDGMILQTIWSPPYSYRLLRLHNYIIQPTAFIRRAALGATLVDESFDITMDQELWLRLGANHRFRRLDRIIAIDRHQPGRKVYTQKEVGIADGSRLKVRHRLPSGRKAVVARKLWKVAFRCAGASLIRRATHAQLAFGGSSDGTARLLVRQLLVPRSRMAMDQSGR